MIVTRAAIIASNSVFTEYTCSLLNSIRLGSSGRTWSIGRIIATLNARIRAAITQWPTPVARTITPADNNSKGILRLLGLAVRKKQSRMKSPIMKPVIFTTETQRVTIEPAISFAWVNSNARRTPNAAGATTAPKNRLAPTHALSSISLTKFRIGFIQSQVFCALPLSADYTDYADFFRRNEDLSFHKRNLRNLCNLRTDETQRILNQTH